MKKISSIVFFTMLLSWAYAQDLTVTKAYILSNDYVHGKEGIDKFLAKPSNATNPEAWYYKAFVYNALTRDKSKTIQEANALNKESFDALKKYKELDPKEKLTKEEQNQTIFNQYYSYYDLALRSYNDKNLEGSYSNFKDALDIHDYVVTAKLEGPNGIKFTALDTDVVWNLALIGNELKKKDEIIPYYKKLVDADLKDPKYQGAYEELVIYYKEKKDMAGLNEYLEKGRLAFPKSTFWEGTDIQTNIDGLTGEALFKKYDELLVKYPNSYYISFFYANDMLKYLYSDDAKNADVTTYKVKIQDVAKKAIAIDNTAEANMLLANYYYNNSFDLSDAAQKIKGTKPDDVKKKSEIMAASRKSLEDCLPYAEKTVEKYSKMEKLKSMDKNNYRQALDMLSEIWRVKGDKVKSEDYKAKKAAVI